MEFIQMVEVPTGDVEAVLALDEQWMQQTEGERTARRQWICQDRDRPGTVVMLVEFPSYEEAMRNNDLPATGDIANGLERLAGRPPGFRNLDVIREFA
jgi:hypothetical protein